MAPSAALPPLARTSIASLTAVAFSAETAYLWALGAGGATSWAVALAVVWAVADGCAGGGTLAEAAGFSGPSAGGVALHATGEAKRRSAAPESTNAEERARQRFTDRKMPLLLSWRQA
jgi:hypothetical protein